jgi:hypothetical protein
MTAQGHGERGTSRFDFIPKRPVEGSRKHAQSGSPLIFGPRGEIGLNWRHRATPVLAIIYLAALPAIVAINSLDLVRRWWRSRKERAALCRKGLLR